ncbi:MAG: cation diffusion facilitator family transporter [Bacteroidales bacterium]|nr:cation diffusion facilitator family transporter [Bacteroidales bacterium]
MKREQKIIRASWWAILGNALLAFLKLGAGFISGSFAVIADGIDSLSDIVSSVVVLVAARIIARPPNIKFPYGYKKADTIATKVLSFMIFFAGAQLAFSTVRLLVAGGTMETPGRLAIWVTLISILGKFLLALLLYRTGRNVESTMSMANARNMRNDILLSLSVLASLLFTMILKEPLIDRIIALLISIFIMYEGFRIFMKSNIDLMDGIDNTEVYNHLFESVHSVKGAHNPHRVRARKIGHYYMINLDIEVDPDLPVREAHDIAKNVENSIKSNLRNIYDVMVHVEPLGNLEEDEKYGITETEIHKQNRKR